MSNQNQQKSAPLDSNAKKGDAAKTPVVAPVLDAKSTEAKPAVDDKAVAAKAAADKKSAA